MTKVIFKSNLQLCNARCMLGVSIETLWSPDHNVLDNPYFRKKRIFYVLAEFWAGGVRIGRSNRLKNTDEIISQQIKDFSFSWSGNLKLFSLKLEVGFLSSTPQGIGSQNFGFMSYFSFPTRLENDCSLLY